MEHSVRRINKKKNIALVAHDECKSALLTWIKKNIEKLKSHNLYSTATTGGLIAQLAHIQVKKMMSGPLGGDQQIGALIAEGSIDMLIFFWDPLSPIPHHSDVKALIRLATTWNIPVGCNATTADFLVSSELFERELSIFVPEQTRDIQHLKIATQTEW